MSKEKKKTPTYKYCFVPNCRSTTITTPNKIFICVPKSEEIRRLWCIAAAYTGKLRLSSAICEDHFKLDEDLENYMEWKMTGCRKRLKEGVYPRYFSCQATSKFASAYVSPCAAPSSSGIKEEVEVKEEDPLAIEDQPQIKVEDGAPSFRLVEPFNFVGIKSESVDLAEDTIDNTRLQ
ncbi:uncharacterized protein LOC107038394 isoform X3 [Diachasma alloeum]|uniref:uncharacterized protein LOC107038394 isoform X3 n=1 Tax=Diachasma alloeum TaxID=454923 RepID=UPI00073812E4|nr:uncharacterized protein LOC107038394 isoform X3 [Diachasma alloeum]